MLNTAELTNQEVVLLEHIRANDFSEITVKVTDGKVIFLAGKKKISNKFALANLLTKSKFQTLEVMVEDGKVVNITQLVKQKL